jgi:hypothetical protein
MAKNYFEMSDDDFKDVGPSSLGSETEKSSSQKEEDNDDNEQENDSDKSEDDLEDKSDNSDENDNSDESEKLESKEDDDSNEESKSDESSDKKEVENREIDKNKSISNEKKEEKTEDKKELITKVSSSSANMKPEELASFYDKVMQPFKANGKDITLKTPEEAVRLMQMGAGYGRKLQEIQPHLKTIKMLEKNNLLDVEKLSYLIDLSNNNPDAVRKLIKESGIDPLDISSDDNTKYSPTDHRVSDTEIEFDSALKEVAELPRGRETIQIITQTWDDLSKQALWSQPSLLPIIRDQRVNGIYDQITSHIEKLKLLGEMNLNTPFLEAYKIAGDDLVSTNSLVIKEDNSSHNTLKENTTRKLRVDPNSVKILGTRVASPKSSVANNNKVKAVSSPNSGRTGKQTVNPLEMADDAFLKQFEGRL